MKMARQKLQPPPPPISNGGLISEGACLWIWNMDMKYFSILVDDVTRDTDSLLQM